MFSIISFKKYKLKAQIDTIAQPLALPKLKTNNTKML